MRRLFAVTGLFVLVGLVGSAGALACSCAERSPKQALRQADAAVVGRLVEVVQYGDLEADFRYRVQRVDKAGRGLVKGGTVSVRAATSGAACGLPRGVDRRYGLLLFWNEGRWTSNLCNLLAPQKMHCAS